MIDYLEGKKESPKVSNLSEINRSGQAEQDHVMESLTYIQSMSGI